MNTLDIVILALLVPCTAMGLVKGFISQAMGLVGLVLGVWLAFHFSELVCGWIKPYLGGISDSTMHILAFVLVLLVVILLLALVGRLIKGLFKFASLGWMDHLLGLIFGLCTAVLVIGLLISVFEAVNVHNDLVSAETLGKSKLYGPLRDLTYQIFPFLKALLFKQ